MDTKVLLETVIFFKEFGMWYGNKLVLEGTLRDTELKFLIYTKGMCFTIIYQLIVRIRGLWRLLRFLLLKICVHKAGNRSLETHTAGNAESPT